MHGLPAEHVGRTIEPEGVFAEAIERGRPVLHRGGDADGAPFAAIVVAPISTAQGVRGILDVCARAERRFDDGDLRLLEAFAGLGAIALRNAEAFEESMRLAQVQTGFFRIASVLGEPLSAAATLDAVAQAATEALGGTAAAVLKPVGSELELVGAFELPEPLRRLLDERRPLETLADSAVESRLLTASDLANDERFATAWRSAAAVAGCRSLLAVPVEEPHAASGGLVVVFFGDGRGRAGGARAQRALRARATCPWTRTAARTHRA